MVTTMVELRPDRNLLDHDFEGYKLNLRALAHFSLDLIDAVDKVFPDEVQYSFVHAKLFALHNHLVLDHWGHSFNYYYIDNKQQVRHITFENTNFSFQNNIVYDVPTHVARKCGHFNICLSFPSSNIALVSDGTGYLHLVDTGPRHRPTEEIRMWQTINSSLILGEDKFFVIVDSRIQEKNNTEILHCLLQSIEQSDSYFNSVLTWVTFSYDGNTWNQMSIKQLRGQGIVHYAAIKTSCTALYIASDNIFKFILDSEKEIKEPVKEEKRKTVYTWLQTSEDITVTFQLEPNFNKKVLKFDIAPQHIIVSYASKYFVDGKLAHKIHNELTTWNIEDNGKVDIVLTKAESMLWDEFIEGGDKNGEQILDASLVEEAHRRLAHLCSATEVAPDQSGPGLSTQELEECDAASEEDTVLVRYSTSDHQITHRVPLSVNQYLFSIKIEPQEVPALALRHHVDACMWQPYAQLVNSDTWPIKHQGTLKAFGYVQASKQNKKFLTCSPNFSYSVVCEATKKHIFIYQDSIDSDSQLRKRSGGVMKQVKVGQQHVFNMDKYGEVLGINATNEFLFILTENKFVAIQIL